jgi:hypothetical protein
VFATKVKLTDFAVSKLKFANDNAGYLVRDSVLAGFFVRVGSNATSVTKTGGDELNRLTSAHTAP